MRDSLERPVLTAHEALDPATTIDPGYQALLLLAVSHRCAGGTGSASAQKTSTSVRARLGAAHAPSCLAVARFFGPPTSDVGQSALAFNIKADRPCTVAYASWYDSIPSRF